MQGNIILLIISFALIQNVTRLYRATHIS